MNELYEFMKQVDVIVIFCIIYGFTINSIVWCVMEFIRFVVKKVKTLIHKCRQKKTIQDDDINE